MPTETKRESVLPADFSGVWPFTNWADEDFVGVWGSKEYHYPAQTTSPMVIPEHSPVEIMHIRKKFARDLAEREFFKSQHYEKLRVREGNKDELGMIQPRAYGMSHAGQYSLDTLAPFIQRALEPLPAGQAVVMPVSRPKLEQKVSPNTVAFKTDKELDNLARRSEDEQPQ